MNNGTFLVWSFLLHFIIQLKAMYPQWHHFVLADAYCPHGGFFGQVPLTVFFPVFANFLLLTTVENNLRKIIYYSVK